MVRELWERCSDAALRNVSTDADEGEREREREWVSGGGERDVRDGGEEDRGGVIVKDGSQMEARWERGGAMLLLLMVGS